MAAIITRIFFKFKLWKTLRLRCGRFSEIFYLIMNGKECLARGTIALEIHLTHSFRVQLFLFNSSWLVSLLSRACWYTLGNLLLVYNYGYIYQVVRKRVVVARVTTGRWRTWARERENQREEHRWWLTYLYAAVTADKHVYQIIRFRPETSITMSNHYPCETLSTGSVLVGRSTDDRPGRAACLSDC